MDKHNHICFPNSKRVSEVSFSLNSDDFNSFEIRKVLKYSREKYGKDNIKYYRKYSEIKLMSLGVIRINLLRPITFEENEIIARNIIYSSLN